MPISYTQLNVGMGWGRREGGGAKGRVVLQNYVKHALRHINASRTYYVRLQASNSWKRTKNLFPKRRPCVLLSVTRTWIGAESIFSSVIARDTDSLGRRDVSELSVPGGHQTSRSTLCVSRTRSHSTFQNESTVKGW